MNLLVWINFVDQSHEKSFDLQKSTLYTEFELLRLNVISFPDMRRFRRSFWISFVATYLSVFLTLFVRKNERKEDQVKAERSWK